MVLMGADELRCVGETPNARRVFPQTASNDEADASKRVGRSPILLERCWMPIVWQFATI